MAMGLRTLILFLVLLLLRSVGCQVTEFISIDCGGVSNYTDSRTGLPWISDMGSITSLGQAVEVGVIQNGSLEQQYRRQRIFPADDKKYCYSLPTEGRRRYLVRATFLYGGHGQENVGGGTYPKFQLYLDATKWANVTVLDGSAVYVKEMVVRAPSDSVDVCLCCATAGSPFISTLELRPLNLSMYATDFEGSFYLKVAARVNFGASTYDSIRYPDDPYDRIWDSDLGKGQNDLVGEAPSTDRIETLKNVDVNTGGECPPVKVMQTAVVGAGGRLSYRLDLEDFPANARAYAYFAEIEDLESNENRKFKMEQPYVPDYSNAVVNIVENANGSYKLYEPSYMNVTLDSPLMFSFVKTVDSTRGPLLNAIEIGKYVPVASKTDTQDVSGLKALQTMGMSPESIWAQDGGDPCHPVPWAWITSICTVSMQQTMSFSNLISSCLSGKNLTGTIPSELQNMDGLTELWLDDNLLTGHIPDMSNLIGLQILHLENNRLNGPLPPYLGSLPSLQEVCIQNNCFSGKIPPLLLSRKLVFNYEGNPKLTRGTQHGTYINIIIGSAAVAVLMFLGSLLLLRSIRRKRSLQKIDQKGDSFRATMDQSTGQSLVSRGDFIDKGTACHIKLTELEAATMKFSKCIGNGSCGPVYYGKMKGGKEVAVKIMADTSSQVTKQFEKEARSLICKGDVISMIDPQLVESTKLESVWRVAEVAIQSVERKVASRPKMQEVIVAIQGAIKIEKGTECENMSPGSSRAQSSRKTLLTSFLEHDSTGLSNIGKATISSNS
ncbi:hypothetical protein Dimus_015196 [Dionaea muscipula]